MSDLDDEELEATRKLNGVAKKSNIEKDIKNIEQYINLVLDKGYCECNELNVISTGKYCDGSKNVAYSMQNILAERKQDKQKIKELEEENKRLKAKIDVTNWQEKTAYESLKEKYITKQKVKDKIEELKKEYEIALEENSTKAFILKCKISALEEFLEDK